MKSKTISLSMAYVAAIGFSIGLLFFFIATVWIGHEAKSLCQSARWHYGGDCVEALIAQLEDENRGFRDRNHAIWALGQLGDARALPALSAFYTGIIPEREPLDEMISQYELKKALALVRGGTNITAWLWRWSMP